MLAAGKLRMSAGARTSTSYTLTVGTKSVPGIPTYDDGFYNSASLQYANSSAVAIGSLSAATYNGKTVNGIYWTSAVVTAILRSDRCRNRPERWC